MVRLIAMLIIFGAPNVRVPAQPEVRCDIRANLLDEDPNGTNVRGGAGRAFPVVGVLPHGRTDVVTVVASKGAWIKISGAEDEDGGTVFDRGGWVFSSLLGMTVSRNPDDRLKKGSHNLYAAPSEKSAVLTRLPAESALTLVGCDGKWAKVKYGQKTGWVAPEAQCTNTRTNCS